MKKKNFGKNGSQIALRTSLIYLWLVDPVEWIELQLFMLQHFIQKLG